MSATKKRVEFLSKPKSLGGGRIGVRVRFNYPDGSTWRGGLTLSAEDEDEFIARIKEAYEHCRSKPKAKTKSLVNKLRDKKDLDWTD